MLLRRLAAVRSVSRQVGRKRDPYRRSATLPSKTDGLLIVTRLNLDRGLIIVLFTDAGGLNRLPGSLFRKLKVFTP